MTRTYGGAEQVLQKPVLLSSLLSPGDSVHSPVLRHHAVLLSLSVHHLQQPRLLTEGIPTESQN